MEKYKNFTIKEERGYVLVYGSNLLICRIDPTVSTAQFTSNLSLDHMDLEDLSKLLRKYTP